MLYISNDNYQTVKVLKILIFKYRDRSWRTPAILRVLDL